MRKATKVWLVIAVSLVLIGCVVFAGVMSMFKWDFSKLSTVKYETNNYEISEEFDGISIKTDTADIIFAVSEDGKCRVECYEEKKAKHSVSAQDGTLAIEVTNNKRWYDYIGLNFGSPKITVYLPKTEYTLLLANGKTGDIKLPEGFAFKNVDVSLSTGTVDVFADVSEKIKIQTTTGNICVEDISTGTLDLSVSTGKVTVSGVTCKGDVTVGVTTGNTYLTDISCKSVISSGSTGGICLDNVVAAEKFSIKRSTGNIKFDRCDAAELFVETSTGDVRGSLLTDKVFITKTSVGKIDVPNTTTGGKCEIKTSTGDVEIKID